MVCPAQLQLNGRLSHTRSLCRNCCSRSTLQCGSWDCRNEYTKAHRLGLASHAWSPAAQQICYLNFVADTEESLLL